ncbi:hypothetical protein EBU95_21525 [bacterium]|nr:hypothetical protein [bacterium]
MKYNLFLDDVRLPKHAVIVERINGEEIELPLDKVTHIDNNDWVIVRNYEQFVDVIRHNGVPETVSFDHDLDREHILHYFEFSRTHHKIDYDQLKVKTGLDCARFLVQYCKDNNIQNKPHCYIHSANEYGRTNIRTVLKPYFNV